MGRKSSNDLKLTKQKRMRRAYLKGYDMGTMMRVKRNPGTSGIKEEHLGYFNYRARGNSYWDEYLEAKFPSKGEVSKERRAALDRLDEITNEVIPEMNVVMQRGGITKTTVKMYFSSDYKTVFFMHEDWLGGFMLKSGVYGSKERALWAFKHHTINWLTRINLPFIFE